MQTRLGEIEGEAPAHWRDSEMLLLQQVMALVGRNLSPVPVLREMLHLMSELLGLNRGRVALRDEGAKTSRIRHAYGLTPQEVERGRYANARCLNERRNALFSIHPVIALIATADSVKIPKRGQTFL